MEQKAAKTAVDIRVLSNELTYQSYLFEKEQLRKFFRELTISEYIALHIISEKAEPAGIYSGRTYLKDLAEKLQLSIRATSEMVAVLKERGLVLWSHDGDGSEGTYVTITETGEKLLSEEESSLKSYYGNVIRNFGKENLIQLLRLMKQLQTVMTAETEKWGETDEGNIK